MGVRTANLAAAAVMAAATAWGQTSPATPAAASAAGVHVIKLTNDGKNGITSVYVAPAGTLNMSDDLLGKQTAGAGKTVTLKVDDPNGICTFDLMFLMNSGDMVEKKGVNLCRITAYSFEP